jgi:hypothetical protein
MSRNGAFSLLGKTSDCGSEEQGSIPESTPKNWEDNGGCLPALDAGGRRFESCFPDILIAGMAEWYTRQI